MQQLSVWWGPSSPHPKRQNKLAPLYRVLIAFFDIPVVTYKNVWQKRATKWNLSDWSPHHGNAPAHSAVSVHDFLAIKQNECCSAWLCLVSEFVSSRFSANVPSIRIFSKDHKLWPLLCSFPCLLLSLLF
jgi:hypothetical protein